MRAERWFVAWMILAGLALGVLLVLAMLAGCKRTASDVHHLTYAHWRNEPLFDLISVCRPCHEQITQMDREGRRAA